MMTAVLKSIFFLRLSSLHFGSLGAFGEEEIVRRQRNLGMNLETIYPHISGIRDNKWLFKTTHGQEFSGQ